MFLSLMGCEQECQSNRELSRLLIAEFSIDWIAPNSHRLDKNWRNFIDFCYRFLDHYKNFPGNTNVDDNLYKEGISIHFLPFNSLYRCKLYY